MVLRPSQSQTFLMELRLCITFMITLNNVEMDICLLAIQKVKQLFMDQTVQVGSLLIAIKYDCIPNIITPMKE